MNWEALGAIGEIVGAVAVIATLGYLAVQIRQNTRALKASTHQSLSDSTIRFQAVSPDNAEVARIRVAGNKDLSLTTIGVQVVEAVDTVSDKRFGQRKRCRLRAVWLGNDSRQQNLRCQEDDITASKYSQ